MARNQTIDVVRGLAIFIMVPANISASVYAEPHAVWFRLFSSLAAPLFVAIAGFMIALSSGTQKHPWQYYAVRGGLLLAVGGLIDALIWQVVPFVSYDVLYLIGLACPLTYLYTTLKPQWQTFVLGLVVMTTPLLQQVFGYTEYPSVKYLWGNQAGTYDQVSAHPTGVVQHLFLDGWFPLFPWLGISFGGAWIAQHVYQNNTGYCSARVGPAALSLLVLGSMLWALFPGPRYVRAGYSEMFYPPTLGFVITALGFVLAALWLFHGWADAWVLAPLRWLGEMALFMYIFHCALIHFALEPWFPGKPLPLFLVINGATVLVLVVVAWGIHSLKSAWPKRPFLVRFLLGG